jgi:hypothetical protein
MQHSFQLVMDTLAEVATLTHPLRVAGHGGGHRRFLQGLPEVRQRQGDLYCAHADPAYTAADQEVLSRAHRHIVGPLPASPGGCTHLLTMVDRSTRWAEAVPLVNTSTSSCAVAFFNSWVSRFGVPATLTSDRGVQFSSAVCRWFRFAQLAKGKKFRP